MNTENNEPRKHKRYDENFKRSAVEMLLQGGKSNCLASDFRETAR